MAWTYRVLLHKPAGGWPGSLNLGRGRVMDRLRQDSRAEGVVTEGRVVDCP